MVALVLRHVGAAVAHQQVCPQSLSFCILHHEHAEVIAPNMPANALHKVWLFPNWKVSSNPKGQQCTASHGIASTERRTNPCHGELVCASGLLWDL